MLHQDHPRTSSQVMHAVNPDAKVYVIVRQDGQYCAGTFNLFTQNLEEASLYSYWERNHITLQPGERWESIVSTKGT